MKTQMKSAAIFLVFAVGAFSGCETAHDVAVTSFRVVDAPANYVRRHIDEESTTTTTTTTVQSDVTAPGHPMVSPTPFPQRTTAQRSQATESAPESRTKNREVVETEPKPSASSQRSSTAQGPKIPYAKPVPGKPGYVYSPFDPNGGYVDVTGYASGSKAKDPYTGKIFIVP